MGTLRLARLRQPVLEPPAEPLALALQPVARQNRRSGPARHDEGLGRDQRSEPPRPLGQEVVEGEPEAPGLAPRGLGMGLGQCRRRVGCALEHDVERVAGRGEGRVEPPRGDFDEAVELFGAHHRAASIDGDQRDQRAVAADQGTAAALQRHGSLGREQTLQRLAPERPAQALEVVDGGCEGERHDDASVPTTLA